MFNVSIFGHKTNTKPIVKFLQFELVQLYLLKLIAGHKHPSVIKLACHHYGFPLWRLLSYFSTICMLENSPLFSFWKFKHTKRFCGWVNAINTVNLKRNKKINIGTSIFSMTFETSCVKLYKNIIKL